MNTNQLDKINRQLVGTLYARPDLIPVMTVTIPRGFVDGLGGRLVELFRGCSNGPEFDVASFQSALDLIPDGQGWAYLDDCQRLMHNPKRVTSRQVEKWSQQLAHVGYRRLTATKLSDLVSRLKAGDDLDAIIQDGIFELNSIGSGGTGQTWRTSGEVADSTRQLVDRWQTHTPDPEREGVKTGFPRLDRQLGNIPNGEICLVGARPSQGKTALVIQVCIAVARYYKLNKIPRVVAIFSAETTGELLLLRLATAYTGVPQDSIKQGTATESEYKRYHAFINEFRSLPIYIDETPEPSTSNMLRRSMVLHNMTVEGVRQQVGLFVFDFVELAADKAEDEIQRNRVIARRLKVIAKTLNCPVIALCQLSREVEKRRDKIPMLSDIAGADIWGRMAYQILFIHRPSYYKQTNPLYNPLEDKDRRRAVIIVAKNKDGGRRPVMLGFVEELTRFYDPSDPDDETDYFLTDLANRQTRQVTPTPVPQPVTQTNGNDDLQPPIDPDQQYLEGIEF